ncbi:MAG TPA: hypothetical protein VIJ51_07185 [Solirubrobacteraceae bacterium]
MASGTGSSTAAALASDLDLAFAFDELADRDLAHRAFAARLPYEEHDRAWCRGAAASAVIAPARDAMTTRQAAGLAAERTNLSQLRYSCEFIVAVLGSSMSLTETVSIAPTCAAEGGFWRHMT